jgi:uncharacterized protein (DUF952 family)
MTPLLHITTRDAWLAAQDAGLYRANSLETEGFIHCSLPQQVVAVADGYYPGREGLVLLVIDPERLDAPVRFEDCYETGQDFPHIYGPLNLDAVIDVLPFPPGPDGTFALPDALARE